MHGRARYGTSFKNNHQSRLREKIRNALWNLLLFGGGRNISLIALEKANIWRRP